MKTYDDEIYTLALTADEYESMKEALERAQDYAVGVAESITIENLLEKLDSLQ